MSSTDIVSQHEAHSLSKEEKGEPDTQYKRNVTKNQLNIYVNQ